MSMEKDRSILDLLSGLSLDRSGWIVVDHWEADLCAIGPTRPSAPGRIVYVSTYNKPDGRYDYECEEAAGPAPENHATGDAGQNVDLPTLIAVLQRHLG